MDHNPENKENVEKMKVDFNILLDQESNSAKFQILDANKKEIESITVDLKDLKNDFRTRVKSEILGVSYFLVRLNDILLNFEVTHKENGNIQEIIALDDVMSFELELDKPLGDKKFFEYHNEIVECKEVEITMLCAVIGERAVAEKREDIVNARKNPAQEHQQKTEYVSPVKKSSKEALSNLVKEETMGSGAAAEYVSPVKKSSKEVLSNLVKEAPKSTPIPTPTPLQNFITALIGNKSTTDKNTFAGRVKAKKSENTEAVREEFTKALTESLTKLASEKPDFAKFIESQDAAAHEKFISSAMRDIAKHQVFKGHAKFNYRGLDAPIQSLVEFIYAIFSKEAWKDWWAGRTQMQVNDTAGFTKDLTESKGLFDKAFADIAGQIKEKQLVK